MFYWYCVSLGNSLSKDPKMERPFFSN